MPRSKTPARSGHAQERSAGVPPALFSQGGRDARAPESPPPSAITPAEVTAANMIREFEEARKLALDKGQAAAAVAATMAKARLSGLFRDKSERNPAPPAKFDGNYAEAARRVALLLRLGAKETTDG